MEVRVVRALVTVGVVPTMLNETYIASYGDAVLLHTAIRKPLLATVVKALPGISLVLVNSVTGELKVIVVPLIAVVTALTLVPDRYTTTTEADTGSYTHVANVPMVSVCVPTVPTLIVVPDTVRTYAFKESEPDVDRYNTCLPVATEYARATRPTAPPVLMVAVAEPTTETLLVVTLSRRQVIFGVLS